MQDALAEVKSHLGREYDIVIGGRRLQTKEKIISVNPANPSEIVGIHQRAGLEHVEEAMTAARAAFESWSRTPATGQGCAAVSRGRPDPGAHLPKMLRVADLRGSPARSGN